MGDDPIFAYMPVKPDGSWWIAGCGATPQEAFSAISCYEGCVEFSECEKLGWKVVAVKIEVL